MKQIITPLKSQPDWPAILSSHRISTCPLSQQSSSPLLLWAILKQWQYSTERPKACALCHNQMLTQEAYNVACRTHSTWRNSQHIADFQLRSTKYPFSVSTWAVCVYFFITTGSISNGVLLWLIKITWPKNVAFMTSLQYDSQNDFNQPGNKRWFNILM